MEPKIQIAECGFWDCLCERNGIDLKLVRRTQTGLRLNSNTRNFDRKITILIASERFYLRDRAYLDLR